MAYRIVFHGTNKKKAAKQILKAGFKKGTYFARHLEDSVCFGGKYVFYVILNVKGNNWQITCNKEIPPSRIIKLVHFKGKELYYNEKARDGFFPKGEPVPCMNCGTDIGSIRLSVLGKPIKARCPKCKKRIN